MWPAWSFALVRLAVALAVAVLLGLITDRMALWLTIVLGGILAWQFVNLFRLQRWLRHRAHEDPPDIGGVWGDVIAIINRIYRRKQFHKRRVMQQFREFRRLSAALPDGVVLLSQGREIRWFNRTAADLLGLRRKVDVGIPIANLVRDPEFAAYLGRPGGGNGVVIRVQGRDAWLALFVIPAGEQFLMLVRDVTREVRLEQMRKDFVANASHELRSPLTVISGYLDELGGGGGHRRGMAGTGRRHAPPGAAHARDRGGPARAFAAGVDGRRGANGAGGRARAPRAPGARGRSVRGGHAADSSLHIDQACLLRGSETEICTRSRRT